MVRGEHEREIWGKARSGAGLTLKQLAEAKGFSTEFLNSLGLADGVQGGEACVEIPYRDTTGRTRVTKRRFGIDKDSRFDGRSWPKGEKIIVYGQERLGEARKNGEADWHEGESDAWTSRYAGRFAFAVPGKNSVKAIEREHVQGFRVLNLFVQSDKDAESFRDDFLKRLPTKGFTGGVRIVRMPAGIKDLTELHLRWLGDRGAFEAELNAVIEAAEWVYLGPRITIRRASDIPPEQVSWVWKDRIPRRKLSLIVGAPDLGKTTAAIDIAARLSVGAGFPDGSPCEVTNTLILAGEDGAADTLVPRLMAAKADMDRIIIPEVEFETPAGFSTWTFPNHLDVLQQYIEASRAGFVIIDPLSSFLSAGIDSNRDEAIRKVLTALMLIAERTGAAIDMHRHLNKGSGSNPINRVGGSIGIVGAARAVNMVAVHLDDENKRVFLGIKANLAVKRNGLVFRVIKSHGDMAPHIEWLQENVDFSGTDVLRREAEAERDQDGVKLRTAIIFLLRMLANGSRRSKEIEAEAERAGITPRTLRRAREELKVKSFKPPGMFVGDWWSELPGQPELEFSRQ
jgi:AAA domain